MGYGTGAVGEQVDREIYPNAPLKLVAFELRMPPSPELASGKAADVYEELREELPIVGQALPQAPTLEIKFGPGPHAPAAQPFRMLDRKRMLSVTVRPDAVVVETTDYNRFEDFRGVIGRALTAVNHVAPFAGVARLGLRYIDEVRVPEVRMPADWGEYISSSLLSGLGLDVPFAPAQTFGHMEYELSERHQVALRYGALATPLLVAQGDLRMKPNGGGPCFLIDVDSYWVSPEDEVPAFDADDVIALANELHSPVRQLFEAAITDKLRNEVLRRPS